MLSTEALIGLPLFVVGATSMGGWMIVRAESVAKSQRERMP